ncbi:MAG: SGNH/GDSL hydrolase family protein [Anaerolineaceae bacterium]|nr:SGNH/GDSL hydrolase family protein [Anaerolineaceae bacterium]
MFTVEIIIVCLAIVSFILYAGNRIIQDPPENNPTDFLQNKQQFPEFANHKTRVLCIGDSITHGVLSCNYVDILKDRLGEEDFLFINAGINGDTSWNILQRLEKIIQCEADIIVILIGTNDTNTPHRGKQFQKRVLMTKKLPQIPDETWFRNNLAQILKTLKKETNASLAILSLPTIGEDLSDLMYSKTTSASAIIHETAREYQIKYLPLHENMSSVLNQKPTTNPPPVEQMEQIMMTSTFKHTVLGKDFDTISSKINFQYHSDHLHLNCKGAAMIADLIEPFILGINNGERIE